MRSQERKKVTLTRRFWEGFLQGGEESWSGEACNLSFEPMDSVEAKGAIGV